MPADDFEETRAEIARRRLADLAATFNASLPDPEDESDVQASSDDDRPQGRWSLTTQHLRFLAVVGAIAVVLVGWWVFSGGGFGDEPDSESLAVAHSTTHSSTRANPDEADLRGADSPETLIVHVVGKVKKPGIVTVPAGARLADAIEAAGGSTGKVDFADLNLARRIEDGEQIRVGLPPALEPTSGPLPEAGSNGTSSGSSGKVNLNSASLAELDTLPGVGPVTAQSIIDWRTKNQKFRTVEDLLDIRGIGEATLERLRPLVTL